MIRVILVLSSILSVFFFPYPYTIILSFFASLFFPVVGIGSGILIDLLYGVPGAFPLPLGTVYGVLITGVAYLVRRFIKARIIAE